MTEMTLALAQSMLADMLKAARERKLNPMAVVVVDARGAVRAAATEDGSSVLRWKVALGKACGCIDLGVGSRRIGTMATERPHFVASLHPISSNGMVPVAGGVLIRDADKRIIGAIGVSGDTSDNDEAIAIAAVTNAALVADGG